MEQLYESGKYHTLDAKISAAVGKILTGDIARQINVLEEKYGAQGRYMEGRQLLWNIYNHYRLSNAEGSLLEFQDLLAVKLFGGDLRTFQADWDETLAAMKKGATQ